jgi:sugar (pentulose or hexulose) kinase
VNPLIYLVGTDIGTLGTKTVVVDAEGHVKGSAFQEYNVLTPRQSWAEQWPKIWEKATQTTIKLAIEKSKIDPRDIAGAAISSLYGGSGIPLDKDMNPIRPCIIWADRRATEECRWLRDKIGADALFKITGNVIDPYYGYTKMLWIKNKEPENWDKIHRFETPNGYVIRGLTMQESIDYSSAGNYGGIFDIHRRDWSDETMRMLDIPRDLFPDTILSSEDVVGEVTAEASKLTGLPKGTPICAGGIDASVSALAGGAIEDGDLASMLGTSMCNGFISHTLRLSPRMINFPYVVKGRQYTYGFTGIATAGFSVRWFRDELGQREKEAEKATGVDAYKQLDDLAAKIPIGSNDLVFLPHLMIGERAPYWDEHLRGGFLGLSVYHTRSHMFRAVLEGVAYAMRYSLEAAWETGIKLNRATLVDGGARSPLWRQIIADVTGVPMSYIPDAQEAPLGDAILAGLGTGVIKDHKVIEKWITGKIPMRPISENVDAYQHFYELYKMSLEANRLLFREMAA